MPFTYTIEPQHNIIHTRGEGNITFADLLGHMKAVSADPLFRSGMNTIADLRNARIMMSLQDAPDLIHLFIEQATIRKRGRWAVVIHRYPEGRWIRFFVTLMEHLPFNMSVFDSRKEALCWLGRNDQEGTTLIEKQSMPVDIHLYGKIRRFSRAPGESHVLQVAPNPNETLASLLERLEIPTDEIYSIFLNSKLLAARSGMARWIGYQQVRADPFDWNLEIPISAGDRIGLFGRDMAALVI